MGVSTEKEALLVFDDEARRQTHLEIYRSTVHHSFCLVSLQYRVFFQGFCWCLWL